MSPDVVTRFAPSPTGALHVGGVRTALLSWAYARGHGGRFIVRMEDTDRSRSSEESARDILQDLRWVGLDWEEGPDPEAADPYETSGQMGAHGPYFQSQRLPTYRAEVDRLLSAGHAYEDQGAVRFRMGKDVSFDDEVYGHIEVKGSELEDFVVLKSDGYPTYHMGVVVDDAAMDVTHVLRGQEHLYNTPKHVALQEALGYARPRYAHLPTILNPDGSKMSKRDKAKTARAAALRDGRSPADLAGAAGALDEASVRAFLAKESDDARVALALARLLDVALPEIEVADFRRSGYLPETLVNYLSLLGWSPGDGVERFDRAFLVERFDFARCGRANSRFDRDKLFRFSADDLTALEPSVFLDRWRSHCAAYAPRYLQALGEDDFGRLAATYQPRSRTLDEPCRLARFFVDPDEAIRYDDKAAKKWLLKDDGAGLAALARARDALATSDDFRAEAVEAVVEGVAAELGVGMGPVAQPLRVAVTGAAVSPGIGDTLSILGRERALHRIDRCLAAFRPSRA